jgi:hypothetical protein
MVDACYLPRSSRLKVINNLLFGPTRCKAEKLKIRTVKAERRKKNLTMLCSLAAVERSCTALQERRIMNRLGYTQLSHLTNFGGIRLPETSTCVSPNQHWFKRQSDGLDASLAKQ